jgi:hypothetical protein
VFRTKVALPSTNLNCGHFPATLRDPSIERHVRLVSQSHAQKADIC